MKKQCVWGMAILMAMSLTACGSNSQTSGTTTAASEAASSAETKTVASGEGSTLTLMTCASESDAHLQAIKDSVTNFNETNEFGVTIEMENLASADYKTKLSTVMAADSEPDIFYTWELGYLENFINGNKVVNLQEYLDEDSAWADSFAEGVLDPYTYDGDVYGIPVSETIGVMYYNEEIFAANNLSVPTTYEEFIEVCRTLKENGVTPMAIAGSPDDAWLVSQYIQQLSNGIAGYDLYTSLVEGTGAWNDEAFVEAAELFQEQIDEGFFEEGFTGVGNEEARAIFQTGQAAMYYNGAWSVATLDNAEMTEVAGHVSCFAMPAVNSEYENISMGSVNRGYAISQKCSNVEAAVAYLKYVTGTEYQEMIAYDYGQIPATKIDIDESRITSLSASVLKILGEQKSMTAWFDRVDTDMGNEFNNSAIAVANGDDAKEVYDDLQAYYESNVK